MYFYKPKTPKLQKPLKPKPTKSKPTSNPNPPNPPFPSKSHIPPPKQTPKLPNSIIPYPKSPILPSIR